MNKRSEHLVTYTCCIETLLGMVRAASEEGALTGLWFIEQKYYPCQTETWIERPDYPCFRVLRTWLQGYFSGAANLPEIRLSPQGTSFQKTVWEKLLTISRGQTRTYGEIARLIAKDRGLQFMSARAVGSAIGRNPISILIPCHRVVGANGKLIGYAGGLEKKKALLKMEIGTLN